MDLFQIESFFHLKKPQQKRGRGGDVHPLARTHALTDTQTHNSQHYLGRDFCHFKPVKQSKQENQGVSKQCISLYC